LHLIDDEISVCNIFAHNLSKLIAPDLNLAQLCRELQVHRTQLHRFLKGESIPRPDVLERICNHFDLDARILTSPLEDVRALRHHAIPAFITEAFVPASQDVFPDGFYAEWRELKATSKQYVCRVLGVKTVNGSRETKIILREVAVQDDGAFGTISAVRICRGIAMQQAAGLFIMDVPNHNHNVTFTALRSHSLGDPNLFSGRKKSVAGILSPDKLFRQGTVLQRLSGGINEAMTVRRMPMFRTTAETPTSIQWLLKDLQETSGAD
jgi:transcriptional regulator with XRE-family HTH domain